MSEFEFEGKKKAKKHLKANQTFTMSVKLTVDGPDENGNSDLIAEVKTTSEGGGEFKAPLQWEGWPSVAVSAMVAEFEQAGLKDGYSATVKGFAARHKEEQKLHKAMAGIDRLCGMAGKLLGEE